MSENEEGFVLSLPFTLFVVLTHKTSCLFRAVHDRSDGKNCSFLSASSTPSYKSDASLVPWAGTSLMNSMRVTCASA